MTNPTNWPNPERPGVPMFPEREMRHVLKKKDTGKVIIRNWKSDGQHWDMIGRSASWCSDTYFYEGTFITATQIDELLAGERERCAEIARRNMNDAAGRMQTDAGEAWVRAYAQRTMANEIEVEIINLGTAP
ncbi:hypothetical protein GOB83_13800 [Acetobacter fabarum]|uniref:hypothetical protein n=1 Tax=Acetobacter fabarum TaxID=483199 RepID=UPI00140544C7|nr:hypothetical protein [Acetobacter fabarum]NHO43228.1 hypothetical protein [Acetobacter fabarum]GBQ36093.1 hypothetical protein AA19596_1911 [Acetobacter fabarum DSM 19596]